MQDAVPDTDPAFLSGSSQHRLTARFPIASSQGYESRVYRSGGLRPTRSEGDPRREVAEGGRGEGWLANGSSDEMGTELSTTIAGEVPGGLEVILQPMLLLEDERGG